jgi:hypothetical protein
MSRLRAHVTLMLASLLALAATDAAYAHGGGTHTGFQARVSYIEPQQPGLLVQVLGGHERLSVSNLTRKNVVIFDTNGGVQERIPAGRSRVWAEPRIGSQEPPPEREGLVRNWRIAGEADGERFAIVGFLGYRPPAATSMSDENCTPTWGIVLAAVVGLLIAAAALALPFLRREGEGEANRTGSATTER